MSQLLFSGMQNGTGFCAIHPVLSGPSQSEVCMISVGGCQPIGEEQIGSGCVNGVKCSSCDGNWRDIASEYLINIICFGYVL